MKRVILITSLVALGALALWVNPTVRGNSAELPVHTRYSPFWTSLEDCQTKILLTNVAPDEALRVTPTLWLEDGTPVRLDPVEVPARGVASIPVNDVMRSKGFTEPHFGGATFRYQREYGGVLLVETLVVMADKNLAYSVPTFSKDDWSSNNQQAVFWLPTQDTEVFFAVHNTAKEPVTVRPKLQIGKVSVDLSPKVLAPWGFAKYRLPNDLPASVAATLPARRKGAVGGVTILYDGPPGVLATTGWIDDASVGYSTMMSFTDPATVRGQDLYGTQIMIGHQPDCPAPAGKGGSVPPLR